MNLSVDIGEALLGEDVGDERARFLNVLSGILGGLHKTR
jgi:hypothetical protein